jgi:hypothetical protein
MIENDTQFEDAESYNYSFDKNKLTFKDIVLLHLKKMTEYASVEMRGGYWETRNRMQGQQIFTDKIYVPDTREIYSNAVEVLADLLSPYFDGDMSKAEEEAEKMMNKAYNSNTVLVEEDREDQNEKEGEEYRRFNSVKDKQSFRSERRKINRKLFRALCCFLYRKKYLEMGSIED